MKKGEIYTGKVTRLDFPNKGIVSIGDDNVVVKNTIPGQTVSFIIKKNRHDMKEGKLTDILERSEDETECG